jgi:hypothetical protein
VNRKTYLIIHAALLCFAFGLLTACGGSSHSNSGGSSTPTVGITTNTGYTASAATGGSFGTFAVTVTSNGTPSSGVSVTFTAPSTGASGTFADGGTPAATDTETTNSSGVATSTAFTANSTAGTYAVTATVSGAATPATFNLTNTGTAAVTITATSGSGQTAIVGVAFANALVATVMQGSTPVNGATVTFTAPATGASGTFAQNGTATDTETTNASGVATSTAFTANSTTGNYSVTATTTGATTPASFSLTNTTAVATTSTYVFYMSGEEEPGASYYALAGAVTLDANGDVVGGEQDYNDGDGLTANDAITATTTSALSVDSTTGLGTLILTTSDTSLGVSGLETFAVQFVNASHALITQFDGFATSSGSLDLQTVTSAANGSYAFALSGIDNNTSGYSSFVTGGVVSVSSSAMTGVFDINDSNSGADTPGTTFSAGVVSSTDQYGRGTVTGIPFLATPVTLAFYTVGPSTGSQALRLIDIDAADTAVGSAYGQGAVTFDNTSLGTDVFGLIGQWSEVYATLGQWSTDGNGNITGLADDNELDNGVQQTGASITGTYELVSTGTNGYGSITLSGNEDISSLGVYMVDPALNINDPNNPSTGTVPGALLVDLDAGMPGGLGVITPQTDTTTTDFAGSYGAGFQDFNDNNSSCDDCEFDMVGPFTMTSGLLSTATIGADDSDPFDTISGLESIGDIFTSTPLAVSAGYYSMSESNTTPNPLDATIGGLSGSLDADIYQASATQLFWIQTDSWGVYLGPIEQQGSLTGVPGLKKRQIQTQAPQHNQQSTKVFGGSSR